MRSHTSLQAIRIGFAIVIAAAPAAAFAQQGQGGAELPPPTLDDPAPPAAPAPAAVPAPAPAPAATSGSAAPPAPATAAPPPATEQAAASAADELPWYKRAWRSMTGWFTGDDAGQAAPAPAQTQPVPAPSPAPQAAAPAAPSRGSSGRIEGYAVDSPERTVRTGVLGECVKTGTWRDGMQVMECDGQAPQAAASAAAEPAPTPAPEPVEVQPLPTPVEEPQAPLAAEPAPQPEPAPEPAPAPRETLTLSADALFAVNSDVLKPTAKDSLADMARKLAGMEYDSVEVVGHTDPTGSAALNARLSKRRAEAVKRYLVEQGVPEEKISTQGVGSSIPVVDPKTCTSLPRGQRGACFQPDRRVDIEVTGSVPGRIQ